MLVYIIGVIFYLLIGIICAIIFVIVGGKQKETDIFNIIMLWWVAILYVVAILIAKFCNSFAKKE